MANRMLSLISPKYLKIINYKVEDLDYCVYFITDGYAVKVGLAASLPSRIKQLQVGNPREIRALYVISASGLKEAKRIENELHKVLAPKHVSGEWFDITSDDIIKVCSKLGHAVGKPISKFDFGIKGIEIV